MQNKQQELDILDWWENLSYAGLEAAVADVPEGIFYGLGFTKESFMSSDVINFETVKYVYQYGR